MSRFVKDGKKSYQIRGTAIARTRQCGQKDYACEVRMLFQFVRDGIRYIQDPVDVELVQTPEKTLELAAGDCDDKSTLLAALLESINHPTRFVAIGFEVGIYSHVYVETLLGTKWVALETTEPVDMGWEPDQSQVVERMEWYN